MTSFTSHTVRAASATLLVLAVASLSGCSMVEEQFNKQRSSSFASVDEAPAASAAHESWVPADATDIHIVEATLEGAEDASILFTSGSPLDPALCSEVPRLSGPSYTIDGAPDSFSTDTVFACGDWSVIASETGWFGWAPNHPDERADG